MNHAVELSTGKYLSGGRDLAQLWSKLMAAFTAATASVIGSPVPDSMRHWGSLLVVLFVLDTLAGFYVAVIFREVKSRKFIEGIANKGVIFSIALTVGFSASMFTRTWGVCFIAIWAGCACEVTSLMEKANRLSKRTDMEFSPMAKFFAKLKPLLDRLEDPDTIKMPVVPVVTIDNSSLVNKRLKETVDGNQTEPSSSQEPTA